MSEDHGAQEAGQLPQGLDQKSQGDRELLKSERRRVRSWTVQNDIIGAAERNLDSTNPTEI